MNTYRYVAKDRKGAGLKGVVEAVSEEEVVEILHKRGLVVVSVQQAEKKEKARGQAKKVKQDELVLFARQLATMIDAGIPLVHVLGILSEQTENKDLKNVVLMMHDDIEGGMSFSGALSKHPKTFSELFINMVKAGETSGRLTEVLDSLALYLEKSLALRRKVRSSLIYPAVIVSMSLIITAALLLKVVPTFKGIFEMLGGELPLATRILIAISDIFSSYFLILVALGVILGIVFKKIISTPAGRYKFDQSKLRVPILGPLFRKIAIVRFSRTFAILIKSGVSVLDALGIVSKTSGSKVVEEAVLAAAKAVREGEQIWRPLSATGVFPPMVCRMISVGERSGHLHNMLSKIADFYDDQVEAATSALTSMIEPVVIAFMGIVIGGIVISLFMPIFKISQLLAG